MKDTADIKSFGKLFEVALHLATGIVIDTFGRRKPAILFYILVSLGWIFINSHWGAGSIAGKGDLWKGYFIGNILNGFNENIASIPFIPDLIMESDQGIAKSLEEIVHALGGHFAQYLTRYIAFDHTTTIIWVLCGLNFVLMITVCPNVKDVIGSPEHISRGSSAHSKNKC